MSGSDRGSCAREVAHMEAISANDIMTMPNPKNVHTYVQKRPAIPPSTNPWVFALQDV
jgi:hypothetical protein